MTKVARAQDAALVAECFLKSFAKSDADVFDGVVLIYVEIANALQFEIEAAVLGEAFEHVIEEPNAGRDGVCASAIDVEAEVDLRFPVCCDGLHPSALLLQMQDARLLPEQCRSSQLGFPSRLSAIKISHGKHKAAEDEQKPDSKHDLIRVVTADSARNSYECTGECRWKSCDNDGAFSARVHGFSEDN